MLLSLVQFQEVGKSSILGKCARVYHYQYSRTFPALPDIFSLALRSNTSSITGEREEKRGVSHKTCNYSGGLESRRNRMADQSLLHTSKHRQTLLTQCREIAADAAEA